MQVQAGDLLLTRNFGGEENNQSPGYYNHSAIIGPLNWVVEAQAKPDSVITVPIWYFFERYPEILVLRNSNDAVAIQTSNVATRYVGRPYDKYMTIRPLWLWKDCDSCISLLRRIYNIVTGIDYKWRIPDSLLQVSWLRAVALKKNYETYKPPPSLFLGMKKVWINKSALEYYP